MSTIGRPFTLIFNTAYAFTGVRNVERRALGFRYCRELLCCLLCLVCFIRTSAQADQPPVFELTTDTITWKQLPGDQMLVLEDNTGKLSFEQVSHPRLMSSFHRNNITAFNFSAYVYWFYFHVKNVMDHDVSICLSTSAEITDYYVRGGDSSWRHFLTGSKIPWNKKDGLKRINAVPLTIKKGEELEIFRRDRLNDYIFSKRITPAIGIADRVVQESYINNTVAYRNIVVAGLLAGLLLLAAIFNLFFYRAVKEKTYLYYSLFLLFYSPIVFGEPIVYFFFRNHRYLFSIFNNALWAAFVIATVNFIRYYFETPQYNPKWDRVLRISAWIYPLQAAAYWLFISRLPHLWVRMWTDTREIVFDIVFLLFFITAILYLMRKDSIKSKIAPALPVLFYWGVIYTSIDFETRISQYLQLPSWLSVYDWLNSWNPVIELICLSWLILFFSWRLFQRYHQLQNQLTQQALEKEIERNQMIAQQKIELENQVTSRTAELKQSLEDLKATQSQLIQSEKMASLGELTAGIAHEIQNPLNFVNNFSDVNKELLTEMSEEIEKGNLNEVKAIAKDVVANEEKINHHGKRADAIVKGMLQHSRAGSGQKEMTDINALTDEYLRLAYHGLRAKDKSFNAKFETDFDDSIGKINIVSQDVGRVILNLITNAFYAVSEKKKQMGDNYEPTVIVSTKQLNGKVEIKVKDNGNGIPPKVLDKMFQPFFTTKPAGQGTGLGLSLSYDIITKGHGGEIKVETLSAEATAQAGKEGTYTAFIIILSL